MKLKHVFTLRKKIKQVFRLGVFMYFHTLFFTNLRLMKGIMIFLSWKNNFLFKKVVGALMTFAPFERRVRYHSVAKLALQSCLLKHHRVLFLLVWRQMMSCLSSMVVSFFLHSFLSSRESTCISFFLLVFSILILIFFIVYFYPWSFYEKIYVFNFVLKS